MTERLIQEARCFVATLPNQDQTEPRKAIKAIETLKWRISRDLWRSRNGKPKSLHHVLRRQMVILPEAWDNLLGILKNHGYEIH